MSVDLASEEEQLRGDTGCSAEDLRLATAEECLELHEQTDRMRVVAAAWEIPVNKYTQSLVGERDSWVLDAIMLLSLLQDITNCKESEPLVDLETKFVQVLRSFNKIQQTVVSINESEDSKRPKRAASDAPTPDLPEAKKQAKQQARSLFQGELPVTQSDEEGTALEVADSQPDHFEDTHVPLEDSISELGKQPVL